MCALCTCAAKIYAKKPAAFVIVYTAVLLKQSVLPPLQLLLHLKHVDLLLFSLFNLFKVIYLLDLGCLVRQKKQSEDIAIALMEAVVFFTIFSRRQISSYLKNNQLVNQTRKIISNVLSI